MQFGFNYTNCSRIIISYLEAFTYCFISFFYIIHFPSEVVAQESAGTRQRRIVGIDELGPLSITPTFKSTHKQIIGAL